MYLSTIIPPPASSAVSPADLLRPYLNRLSPEPLFEAYYLSNRPTSATKSASSAITVLYPYPDNELLTEGLDWEAEQGEKAFWSAMDGREAVGVEDGKGFFDRKAEEGEDLAEDADS